VVTGEVIDGLARLVFEPDNVNGGKPVIATVTSEGWLLGATFSAGFHAFWTAPDADAETPCSEAKEVPDPIYTALKDRKPAILHGIHFDVDSDTLRPEATPTLERILAALQAAADVHAIIEGHTDADGSEAHN